MKPGDLWPLARFGLLCAALLRPSWSRADAPPPGKAAAGAANATADTIEDVLSGIQPDNSADKPKDKPPALPAAPALAPFVAALPKTDTAAIRAVGWNIVDKLKTEQDPAQRQLLLQAGARLVNELDRRNPAPSSGAPTGPVGPGYLMPNIDKLAYRQAQSILANTGGQADRYGSGSNLEPLSETASAAWGGVANTGAVVMAPGGGTRFFERSLTPVDPGSPRKRPSDSLKEPPPPVLEKGVRISFDANTLQLAEKKLHSMDALEDQLIAAKTPADICNALQWLDQRVGQALAGDAQSVQLDHVTIVSLGRLLEAAAPYSRHWNDLPSSLRNPGGLKRIHGLLIDPAHHDLVLIGVTDGPGEPITIDELITGFRSVWRDRLTPICSLDPSSADFGGPQKTVIGGVDRNSRFARVMLDADYTMKRLIFGQLQLADTGFMDLPACEKVFFSSQGKENAELAGGFMARFWFVPVPPGEGQIRLANDGHLAMFDCRVQVLTENLQVSAFGIRGLHTRNPVIERITQHLTDHFDALETQYPVVRQLHALCDIALAAQVAHRMNDCPDDLLNAFSDLPSGSPQLPATYQGLNVPIEVGGMKLGAIQGGVNMASPLGAQSVVKIADQACDNLALKISTSTNVDQQIPDASLLYVAAPLQAARAEESALTQAQGMVAGGNWKAALNALDSHLSANPNDAVARRLRLRALCGGGLYFLAERELEIIAMLDAGTDIEDLRLKIHLDRGDAIPSAQIPEDRRKRLAALYFQDLLEQTRAGAYPLALATLERLLKFTPDNSDLYSRRAQLRLKSGQIESAFADFARAIALSPRSAQPLLDRATARLSLGKLDQAMADATAALGLDPTSEQAYQIRLDAAMEGQTSLDAAYDDTRRLLAIAPRDSLVYVYRAEILERQGDRDGAMAAASQAVRIDPGVARGYAIRGQLLAPGIQSLGERWAPANQERFIRAFSDFNAAIALSAGDWQCRQLRAEFVVDMSEQVGQPNIDWDKLFTVVTPAMLDCPRSVQFLQMVAAVPSDQLAPQKARYVQLALLYAAHNDCLTAVQHAPKSAVPALADQTRQIEQIIAKISGETKP